MEGDNNENNELKMYDMAKRGGLEYVDRALANKADPNWQNPDDYQKTALHQASTYNNSEIVRSLVAAGADINLQDKYGNTPLFHAACSVFGSAQGSLEAITTLIELGAGVDITCVNGTTPLMVAKHIGTFEALIAANANVSHIDNSGKTVLHSVANDDLFGTKLEDKLEMVKILLQKGLDPSKEDNKGMTPVDYAKKQGYHEMVTMIVGDNVEITELDLFNAVERGDEEYVNKAIANKTNLDWLNLNERNRTALHQAARWNYSEIVKSLLAAGANKDLQDKDGETSIYLASHYGQIDAVTTLLEYGADIEIASNGGLTPLMTAWRVQVVEALIDANANLRQTDGFGRTALHYAIWSHKPEEAQLLLQKGMDTRKQDNDGLTAADYAREYNQDDLADIIDSFTASNAPIDQPSPTAPSTSEACTTPTGQPSPTVPSTSEACTAPTGQPSTTASAAPSTTATSSAPTKQLTTETTTTPDDGMLLYLLPGGLVLFIAMIMYWVMN